MGTFQKVTPNIISVSAVNRYIKGIMSRDIVLSNLFVKGEISNFKYHSSGHMYFTLKDQNSIIKCVMFKTSNISLRFTPENGMVVVAKGSISVFERDGQYQLYVEEMQNDGVGNLHVAFEQLKKKLYEEGLFDTEFKKKLPFLPQSIGVVTSMTGSVILDIINVLSRRWGNINIKIFPVRVQGAGAGEQIARAVDKFNILNNVDVIILARGGGSIEELWPFNEEIVARAIFRSSIPIISAVGHETDYTISDFVADVRAPTPSAGAEIVAPLKEALKERIIELEMRIKDALLRNLTIKKDKFLKICDSFALRHPYDRVYQERMKLDIMDKDLKKAMDLKKERWTTSVAYLVGKLDALSPLTILTRGYSVAKAKKTGNILKSIDDVENGDQIELSLWDGSLNCIVNSKDGK